MTPKRTFIVSNSWMTLVTNESGCCRPRSPITWRIDFSSSPKSWSGTTTPGKRSEMMFWNSSTSSFRNLGRLESRMARMSTTSSDSVGLARLSEPAMTSTDLTARMPKS